MKQFFLFCFALLIFSCEKVTDSSTSEEPIDGKVYDTIPVPIPRDSSIIDIAK